MELSRNPTSSVQFSVKLKAFLEKSWIFENCNDLHVSEESK